MTGDNMEHVIGYWVIWQVTHSPFWLGYAVVAHWLPFTLFSLYSGSLADRTNYRSLMQLAQGIYILVSLSWGYLFLTDQIEIWHISVLLVCHGIAGLIYGPSSMLIIHDMVGADKLVSAISLNASLRPMANSIGPMLGGGLMATVGPGWAFCANALIYLPLTTMLFFLPYGRSSAEKKKEKGWPFILEGISTVKKSPTIVTLLVVVSMSSLLMGNAFQAFIPPLAERLGLTATGYSVLLAAFGMGAILGGFVLGWIGSTKLRPIVVTIGGLAWSALLIFLSLSRYYPLSLGILCLAGITQIVLMAMSQSIVQSWAPKALRGRVIGIYNFAAFGMRALSGFLIGSLATLFGTPMPFS